MVFDFAGDAHAPESRSDEKGNQETYTYDANGNLALADLLTYYDAHMPIRYSWNEENRLSQVEVGNRDVTNWYTMFYVQYDADGQQVIRTSPGEGYGYYPAYTRHNVGSHYEVETTSAEVTKYYQFNGQRIAMEQADVLYYLFSDHLGSASVSYRADDGSIVGQRYHPWGEVKGYNSNQLPSDYTYTGQEDVGFTRAPSNDPIRILNYGARYYWPDFGRFISPDTIVPEPGNPQSLNRYTYANNNALRYTDPSGYDPLDAAWQEEFRANHDGRVPTAEDILIRLFSIAFPDEWDWSAFYTSDGQLRGTTREIFARSPAGRNWSNIPGATERLAGWYNQDETEMFIRDTGSLFGGLLNRLEEQG